MDDNISLSDCQETYGQDTYDVSEELPVTLQIAMIASDGIVLASDRCSAQIGAIRDSSQLCKIFISGLNAFAFSGDDCALHIAEDLAGLWNRSTTNSDAEIKTKLQTISESRYRKDARDLGSAQWIKVRTWARAVLAIVNGSLWRIDIGRTSTVKRILDKSVSGDGTNSARFFSEQYYEDVNRRRPLSELIPLAAHVILMGHERNHEYVRGLDLAIWRNGNDSTLRLLESQELESLAVHSKNVNSRLREIMFQQRLSTI